MTEPAPDYLALLEHSFAQEMEDSVVRRLQYLSEHIFDFTTYDTAIAALFASKALEVCAAINAGTTFDYFKDNEDNYRWYLLMVNMPFLAGRLDWGTSIRGAWWAHENQRLESCGLWRGDEQVLSMEFTRDEWMRFIAAMIEFAAKDPK